MGSLVESFRFLSALPLPRGQGDERSVAGAVAWFPLVGAVLGALFVLVDWLCGRAFPRVSHFVSATVILAVYALFTGGLHHDGLMDTADALWGGAGRTRERRLAIMKDSRTGALGVTAIALVLLLELAAIYSLPVSTSGGGHFRWAALFIFPVLGRWAMSYLCIRFPYARPEGTGATMVGGSRRLHLLIATVPAGGALAAAFLWLTWLPLLIPLLALGAWLAAELIGGWAARRLGGVTGDIIGAAGILTEAALLLLLASRLPELLVK